MAFMKYGERLIIGLPAKRQAVVNSANTIFQVICLDMSVMAFMKHGKCLIRLPAKQQAVVNSANTIFAFKWLIGQQTLVSYSYGWWKSPRQT